MLFMEVTVQWSLARNFGRHVLRVARRSFNNRTVRFAHSNVLNIQRFCRTLILKTEHTKSLNARHRLDANLRS